MKTKTKEYDLNRVNATQLSRQLKLNASIGHTTFILGPPGSGKTQIVRQTARQNGMTPIDFIASDLMPEDVGGFVVPDTANSRASRLMPDIVASIIDSRKRDGKPVMAFFDELTNGSNSVMAACFKLLHEGRAGGYEVPPDTVFVAAGNNPETSSVAQELPAPLINRMALLQYPGPDFEEWESHALGIKCHPAVLGFIKMSGNYLTNESAFDDGAPTPTPRSWIAVSDVLHTLDEENGRGKGGNVTVDKASRLISIASRVGSKAAVSMEAALVYADKLHTWDAIKANPEGIRATDEFAPAYMQAVMLVASIAQNSEEEAKIAMTYVKRLPKEAMHVMTTGLIKRPDGKVMLKAVMSFGSYKGVAEMAAAGRSLNLNY